MKKVAIENIKIDENLLSFINHEAIPGTNIEPKQFWKKFVNSLQELVPLNKSIINKRIDMQKLIDDWYKKNKKGYTFKEYENFLKTIGYLVEEKEKFEIETQDVDDEISKIAGPQLVVPVDNARYALNAVNARWGSFYDALYGTDVIPNKGELKIGKEFNHKRAEQVIKKSRDFLNNSIKINHADWEKVEKIIINENEVCFLIKDKKFFLKDKSKFIGFNGDKKNPSSVLFKNNNLHIDILIDQDSEVGRNDKCGIKDIILESAISTIIDNEDSVAAVDAEDKIKCYRNWLGIMKGDLNTKFKKGDSFVNRKLNEDRNYLDRDGKEFKLHGRSLILNRNVGHLMTNPAIILEDGSEIPEGIMDAFFSSLCALHDLKNNKNSRTGSIYIVKPKMHGPDEVEFTNKIFLKVEDALNLKSNTIKVGIMDEERRTTINLKECIRRVKKRIVFINTGFLDRTGDEIHTSFEAGPMIFKNEMKSSKWLNAYENWNTDIGLECGFSGKAQIGKGMWAMPDKMSSMLEQKINHPKSGANCAWVPSPTAATLHATHYHYINVFTVQKNLRTREKAKLNDILTVPVADRPNWSSEMIQKEIENNVQSILGYVVRWVDQGIGCSKVPDINDVGLMEDRATLRISSQHIANWIHQGVCSKNEVLKIFQKMAKIVDGQNSGDKNYKKMSDNFDNSTAFKAACDLVFKGKSQICGYTEPLLHKRRLEKKTLISTHR